MGQTTDTVSTGGKNPFKYQAIIDAAIHVFAQLGYHGAQVSRIAKRAGVAEGTVYLYFRNKEDLLISAFREKMNAYLEVAERELDVPCSACEKLRLLVRLHFTNLAADRDLALFLQLHLRQPEISVRGAIAEPLKRYSRLIEGLVEQGMEKCEFRPEVNAKLARQVIFGAMDEVASCWVLSKYNYSLLEQEDQVFAFLCRALAR